MSKPGLNWICICFLICDVSGFDVNSYMFRWNVLGIFSSAGSRRGREGDGWNGISESTLPRDDDGGDFRVHSSFRARSRRVSHTETLATYVYTYLCYIQCKW